MLHFSDYLEENLCISALAAVFGGVFRGTLRRGQRKKPKKKPLPLYKKGQPKAVDLF
jgi:hypothetical protein